MIDPAAFRKSNHQRSPFHPSLLTADGGKLFI
jgi:hypothetical protein